MSVNVAIGLIQLTADCKTIGLVQKTAKKMFTDACGTRQNSTTISLRKSNLNEEAFGGSGE
jgi:hypothetical protein